MSFMNAQQKNKEKGFTIIEVVLVLAIAGLIFLMVFIALPALQRGQRDTQRRDDVSRFISQLNSYATNNRGSIPSTSNQLTTFKTTYLKWTSGEDGEFKDPQTGVGYVINFESGTDPGTPDIGEMQYIPGVQCSNESLTSAGSSRQAAVRTQLESGGIFCQNAQ
jgi:prepilin-type N-terminal cleavage/methylation domain-containing protein